MTTEPKSSTAYLVPDAPALCSQLHLITRLVSSEKFLLLIPLQGEPAMFLVGGTVLGGCVVV